MATYTTYGSVPLDPYAYCTTGSSTVTGYPIAFYYNEQQNKYLRMDGMETDWWASEEHKERARREREVLERQEDLRRQMKEAQQRTVYKRGALGRACEKTVETTLERLWRKTNSWLSTPNTNLALQ